MTAPTTAPTTTADSTAEGLLLELGQGASVNDWGHRQCAAVRQFLNGSLLRFAWWIFDYRDLSPGLHDRVSALIGRWGQPGWERLMIQIPRESFKTSLCTRANALWQICRDPNATIAIFNEREENAKKWVRAIREVAEGNALFKAVYGDLLPRGLREGGSAPRRHKWNDVELLFERGSLGVPEASITALGITAATTGGHWTHIIKDDILSFEASRSPSVMRMVRDWIDAARYLERPSEGGNDLFVCTPWGHDDAYRYVLEKWGDEYRLYRRSALEGGKSILPDKWSTEKLERLQQRDPYTFSAQMMCRPMAGRDQSFQREWLRYGYVGENDVFHIHPDHYDPNLKAEGVEGKAPQHVRIDQMEKALLVDPAPSEQAERLREPKARNALVEVGIDAWGRLFILDVWTGRPDPLDVIHKMIDLSEQWQSHRVAIEKVVFSVLYKHWLRDESRRRNLYISCYDLEPARRSKDTRIENMIPGFRQGLYYLNDANPGVKELIQEFVEYPYGVTRDILDALAYAGDVLRRPETPDEVQQRWFEEERPSWPLSTRDPVTGYILFCVPLGGLLWNLLSRG